MYDVFLLKQHREVLMTSNNHPIRPIERNLSKALPVMLSILVWLFAATFETGYVAVLNSGIHHSKQPVHLA